MTESRRADWQGVGESFQHLGRMLTEHARDAGGAISAANEQAVGGVVDQVSTAFRTAVDRLDETTTDPEVSRAAKTATARLLDAIKAELTGEGAPPADPGPAPADPGPTSGAATTDPPPAIPAE